MADDIAQWLEGLGLVQYAQAFADNEIDFEVLPDLTEDDLEKLGLPMGPRKKLLKAIGGLANETAETPSAPSIVASSSATSPDAERRQLTVLFCDLVGSTALSASLDPEDMREVLRAYQEACSDVIAGYDGYVAKFMGDGVYVYFGYPRAHEDDAERAINAGLGIVEAVGGLERDLAVRIGVATGTVAVGDIVGEGASEEAAIVGEAPNLAARLQGIAEPDTVVIGEATHTLAGGLFETEDLGERDLKGFAAPVGAWAVIRPRRTESRFEATRGENLTELIGRDEEMEILLRRWRRAKSGEGQLVLITGEPGIGKSRLARELRERIADDRPTVITTQFALQHANSAMFPFVEQMRRAIGFEPDDTDTARLDKLENWILAADQPPDKIAPIIAPIFGVDATERYPALDVTPERRKTQLFETFTERLSNRTSQNAVLYLVEDAHWADPTTLELLSLHIERCIGSDRILFVITYRPEFEAPWIGQPHTSLMTLNRLAPVQSAALVAHASGGKHLPVELIERIAQRTDGVPLFIEELTKSIIESGDDNAPNSLAIPVTLQDALEARLDRLGEAREIAQIGALIGRSFDYELLTQVADSDDRAVRRYLDRLVDSGLVFRHGASPETAYTFKHALVQDTAYQSLLRSRRVELHAKVAQAIEERFSNQSVAEPELLAHHFEAAGQFEPALKYWQQAGEQAIQRTANAEAVAHLTTALELLTKLPSSPERVRKELELQIYLGSPLQALKGYGAPEVERAYNRARELSEQVGDVPLLAAAFRGSYVFHLMRGELATAHGYAGQLLELAESVEDPALLLEADFAYGQTLLFRAELVSAIKYLERGIKTYDPDLHGSHAFTYGQDPGVYCNVLAAYAYWLSGKPDTALDRARGAIRIAESISHPLSRAAAFVFNAMIHQFRREPDDCAALADTVIELSNEQQLPFFAAWGTILKGWADVERGILDTGTALVDDGISAWKVTAGDMHRPYFLGLLADIHAKSGNAEAGFALLEEACRISETNGENWSRAGLDIVEARLHAVMARGAESEAKYREAMERAQRHDSRSVELSAAIGLANLLTRDGRTTEARDILVPVYDAFTEGFDTMDLKDAERLIAELS